MGAGAGSRFGMPKAEARLASGERFLDVVVRLAALAGLAPIIAVTPPGAAVPPPARGVANADARGEQIGSVRLGLAQLVAVPAPAALLWPVDHPAVALESVLALVAEYRRTGAPVVVPTFGGRRGHPVLFARDVWRELMTVEAGGARTVVHAHAGRLIEVPVNDAGILRDIDTPSDLP